MPVYDYICDECEYQQEYTQSYNSLDQEIYHCNMAMRRIISAVPTLFKAKGFYSTDK